MERLKKNEIIAKAIENNVTSQNTLLLLNLDEIIYLDKIRRILNCFSLESMLYNFAEMYDIPPKYKKKLKKENSKEARLKTKYEKVLYEAFMNMPEKIADLMPEFLTKVLKQDFTSIDSMRQKILSNPQCQKYIQEIEKKLDFNNPYNKTNLIEYMKKKYSHCDDYYYAELISNIMGSDAYGLLYITFEELNFCL